MESAAIVSASSLCIGREGETKNDSCDAPSSEDGCLRGWLAAFGSSFSLVHDIVFFNISFSSCDETSMGGIVKDWFCSSMRWTMNEQMNA